MPLDDGFGTPLPSKPSRLGSPKKSRDGSPLPQSGRVPSAASSFAEPDLFGDAPLFSADTLNKPQTDKVAEAVAAASAAEATKDRYASLLESSGPSMADADDLRRTAAAGIGGGALQTRDTSGSMTVSERTDDGWRAAGASEKSIKLGDKVDVEREMVDSGKRAERQGLNAERGRGVEAMTTEEYNALGPKEKAAIDFNTMLVAAVRSDRNLTEKGVLKDGSKEYDSTVDELFGEGSSEKARYAPATVQLLDAANVDLLDAKLNDFLKLKVAITADDLKDFDPSLVSTRETGLLTPSRARAGLQAGLVDSVRETRRDPAQANALRTSSRSLLGMDDMLGFSPGNPEGTPDEQASFYFQGGLQRLANEPDTQKVMADLRAGMPEEYWPKFIAFLDASSRESKQNHMPISTAEDGSTVRPKEFRSRLGLNKVGARDATR